MHQNSIYYLIGQFAKNVNKLYLILVMVMLFVLTWFYYFNPLLKNLSTQPGLDGFFVSYFLYVIPFGLAYFIQHIINPRSFRPDKWFWCVLFLAPAFFSLRVNFKVLHWMLEEWPELAGFAAQSLSWIIRSVVLLVPALVLWWVSRERGDSIGLHKSVPARPYMLLLMLFIPVLLWAATRHDFLNMYPRAMSIISSESPTKLMWLGLFELSYALDFFCIELFFRGFLVIALIRTCGIHAIIPAACFYCVIHFGKPLAEVISSFFGGIFLGIISHHSRSIWGGVIIHVGIGWLMEIAGYIGHELGL